MQRLCIVGVREHRRRGAQPFRARYQPAVAALAIGDGHLGQLDALALDLVRQAAAEYDELRHGALSYAMFESMAAQARVTQLDK